MELMMFKKVLTGIYAGKYLRTKTILYGIGHL